MSGSGFIASLTMPSTSNPVTVLLTNHHVIHNLDTARKATYQFSYLELDGTDTPNAILGEHLIPKNSQKFYTSPERYGVSKSLVICTMFTPYLKGRYLTYKLHFCQ